MAVWIAAVGTDNAFWICLTMIVTFAVSPE